MSAENHQIIEVGDRTALVCADGTLAEELESALQNLAFKCHTARIADRAIERMKEIQYDVIAIAETFDGATLETNEAIGYLAPLPMIQRRASYVFIVGQSFRSLDAMQAFQQSVHLVVNPSDMSNLEAILKKGLSDSERFYRLYRAVLAETGQLA